MIPENKFVKNSGVARGAGLAARPECHHFGMTPFVLFFLFSFETENPLIGRQKPFSSCHYILSNRKPTRFEAKTFIFIFYLVFIYFSANKGCHHEIPPRVPPLLATPLVKKFLWKALFHRKFLSTFLLILTQI